MDTNGATATTSAPVKETISFQLGDGADTFLNRVVIEEKPWYSIPEVHRCFFMGAVGATKFGQLAKGVTACQVVSGARMAHMLAALKQTGMINSRAPSHSVVDHQGLMQFMVQLQAFLPAQHHDLVRAVHQQLNSSVAQQWRAPVLAPPAPAIVQPPAAKPAAAKFEMPAHGVPTSQLHGRYGMLTHPVIKSNPAHPYLLQVRQMQQWSMAALQPQRDGPGLAARSWHNVQESIHLYIGFAVKFGKAAPSLVKYQDIPLFMRFLSFQKARGNSLPTLQSHCRTGIKVLEFLCLSLGLAPHCPAMAALQAASEQLQRLCRQLPKFVARKRKLTMADLVDESKALPLAELVGLAMRLFDEAHAAVAHCVDIEACIKVQDALMFGMLIGYFWSTRESIITGISHPAYAGPCRHPDCSSTQCRGNRSAQCCMCACVLE